MVPPVQQLVLTCMAPEGSVQVVSCETPAGEGQLDSVSSLGFLNEPDGQVLVI